MKRLTLLLAFVFSFLVSANAMSYREARERAWFLTDKMAYELNLTPEQYDRVYEINLDYLMSLRSPSDCSGAYWRYRNVDLRYILFDWQYDLYRSLSYFFRPVVWVRSSWHYPVCRHYRYGYYYFDHPTVYVSYRGRNWRGRGHHDRSPYYGMKFHRGKSLRDRYKGKPWYGDRPGRKHKEWGRDDWDDDDDDRDDDDHGRYFKRRKSSTYPYNRYQQRPSDRRRYDRDDDDDDDDRKSWRGFMPVVQQSSSSHSRSFGNSVGRPQRNERIRGSQHSVRRSEQGGRSGRSERSSRSSHSRRGE
ncbi:hypothetical protein, secreted [gut metagenome]|uniref:Uncharacterized protein n=1 Tax=gut metagenome TaxID=749906 RepID=J9FEL8_9ZZZZ